LQNSFSQRLDESYRWDLWAVAYIVTAGVPTTVFT
jgi:hypothetical protein